MLVVITSICPFVKSVSKTCTLNTFFIKCINSSKLFKERGVLLHADNHNFEFASVDY